MKKLLFSSAFILGFYCIHAQDTLRYDYALLDIDASFWGTYAMMMVMEA
ncbi:MAG: hypothetical protein JSS76_09080 [Bacteroidetes bacterium]|nr:hypothetical protein [Bacteroidota bacterium]